MSPQQSNYQETLRIQLFQAILEENRANFRALLEVDGINLNRPDLNGDTALHLAVQTNQPDLIFQLYSAGAQINSRNAAGQTPLGLARQLGANEAIEMLEGLQAEHTIRTAHPRVLAITQGYAEPPTFPYIFVERNLDNDNQDNISFQPGVSSP